jgi:hypothetical protein
MPPTGETPMPDEQPGPAAECRHCPVCAGLAALREARPEVAEHLVKAGAELLLAARALLEGVAAAAEAEPGAAGGAGARAGTVPAGRGRRRRPAGRGDAAGNGLQRIDVG